MAETISKYNGPIAVLDFLGFKQFVEKNTLQDVINTYGHELTATEHTSKILKEDLEFMVYSDTIALRLVNQTDTSFLNFIKALQLIAGKFFMKLLNPELISIPLRGAISIGDYAWHNGNITSEFLDRPPLTAQKINFIVGQAIIDAHELEKRQQWIGISMNEETANTVKERFPEAWETINEEAYMVKYDIPSIPTSVSGFVVNPTVRPVFAETFELFLNKCEGIFKSDNEQHKTKLKYFNTMKLIDNIHLNDNICPRYIYKKGIRVRASQIKIDKTKYNELIKYFEENQDAWKAAE
jgi:hypothetical protein